MTVLIDTERVPPRERLDFWTTASSQLFMPLEVVSRAAEPFHGLVDGYELGALRMYRLAGDPASVRRTPAMVRASDPEQFHLILHLGGHCIVEQEGRSASLRAGDMTGIHSSRPFEIRHDRPVEALLVACPLMLLRPYVDRVVRDTGTRIIGSDGLGRVVSPFLRQLLDSLDRDAIGEPRGDLGESVLILVRGLCTQHPDTSAPTWMPGALMLAQIKGFIEESLDDPALCPERISRAHSISTRYLYKLFEAEGLGVQEWIRTRRLDRCRRDLADPRLRGDPVFRVATRWGFTSQAHFSRLFRATYGCSPREFRRAVSREARAGDEPGDASSTDG